MQLFSLGPLVSLWQCEGKPLPYTARWAAGQARKVIRAVWAWIWWRKICWDHIIWLGVLPSVTFDWAIFTLSVSTYINFYEPFRGTWQTWIELKKLPLLYIVLDSTSPDDWEGNSDNRRKSEIRQRVVHWRFCCISGCSCLATIVEVPDLCRNQVQGSACVKSRFAISFPNPRLLAI